MRHIVVEAWKETVAWMKADLRQMPLSRWNEFVLRFVYSRALTERAPDVRQEFECGRIDLVLCRKSKRVYVEFKFYVHARHDPLTCSKKGRKGGPGRKNCQEFARAVEKLRERSIPRGVLKIVALFYCDPVKPTGKTYDKCYGDDRRLKRNLGIRRLDSTKPIEGSENICHSKLFEVLPRKPRRSGKAAYKQIRGKNTLPLKTKQIPRRNPAARDSRGSE